MSAEDTVQEFLFNYTEPMLKYNGVTAREMAKRLLDQLRERNEIIILQAERLEQANIKRPSDI